ncbi:hypothetical protein ACH5RR_017976 [Cinchona calisaya]|uniref:Uncharacterized protein n=1 Tax=Cinchona calisaya TaxID=153742 RepID=A0ABD2ZNU5_9GENT
MAVAIAEQPQNTRTGIDPIMAPRSSMITSKESVNADAEVPCHVETGSCFAHNMLSHSNGQCSLNEGMLRSESFFVDNHNMFSDEKLIEMFDGMSRELDSSSKVRET